MSDMIEVSVAGLECAALDWAVAEAAGLVAYTQPDGPVYRPDNGEEWTPSTDWSQGGPLIERYKIAIVNATDRTPWIAMGMNTKWMEGETPLIAAMRAIVAAELGDTVHVPTDLMEAS